MHSKPPGHLDPTTRTLQMLSPEALTLAQRERAYAYIAASGVTGALVGAVIGQAEWDIRPLLFEQGVLSLLRFTDPALGVQKESYDLFGALSERLMTATNVGVTCGRVGLQYWQQRRFYQRTLGEVEEINEAWLGTHPVVMAQHLTALVQAWQQAGIVHGHLCAANIALEGGRGMVVDFGFRAFSSEGRVAVWDMAPELSAGGPPSHPADLYGLGLVLKLLLQPWLGAAQARLLDDLLRDDPALRPPVEKVLRELFPITGTKVAYSFGVASASDYTLKMGKLLGQDLQVKSGELQPRSADEALHWLQGTAALDPEVAGRIRDHLQKSSGGEVRPLRGTDSVMAVSYTHLTLPTIYSV